MENISRETRKKWLWILIPCLSVCILQAAEYMLHLFSLELRTNIQLIKGMYVWVLAPLLIVGGFYRMYADGDSARICRMLTGILCILVLGISYARLGLYLDGECKTEQRTEEELLLCTVYNGSWKAVYEPLYGVFRIPFHGWEDADRLERLKDQYGPEVELAERLEDGTFLYQAKSGRTGVGNFYLQVENDYWLTGNFDSQLMKSDASVFWRTRNRAASLYSYQKNGTLLELKLSGESEDVNSPEHAFDEKTLLNVYCFSEADLSACAADLADWYLYAGKEKRYLEDGILPADTPLSQIHISGPEPFYVEFEELYGALSPWAQEVSWLDLKESIEQKLTARYQAPRMQPSSEEVSRDENGMPADKEAWAASFMEVYDGESCEKECAVGDGRIRYRMVCIDAALGSRAYALLKSSDGGASWEAQEMDPFGGQWGMGIDFAFLTEEYGFASLMHNGGDEADLYVTEDGGHTYHLCVFEGVSAELENGYYYQPYDYPRMPYEEDGHLYVLCGQGMDGDYAGGDAAGMALFESTDSGYTFLYQGIKKRGQQEP